MLDGASILRQVKKYTNFGVTGPDEVTRRLYVPYYITNNPVGGQSNGKATPEIITEYIFNTSSNWTSGGMLKPTSVLQNYMDTHPQLVGVDCSGLVYYVLNEASNGAVMSFFEGKEGTPLPYLSGVSAQNLTRITSGYGTAITQAKSVVPGCTILFNPAQGSTQPHVLVVYGIMNTGGQFIIQYAHSSGGYGPHLGYIKIGDLNANLGEDCQMWVDDAFSDAEAKRRYVHTALLNCVK